MCQSQSEGGRRCSAHTRIAYRRAVKEVLSSHSHASTLRAREAGREAVVAHAMTPAGRIEIEEDAERLYYARRRYVDGGLAAQWLLMSAYEADERRERSLTGLPSDALSGTPSARDA